jgi:hypothetical protein
MSSVSINQSISQSQSKSKPSQTEPNQTKPNQTKQAKKAQMKPGYQIQTLCARAFPKRLSRGGKKRREGRKRKKDKKKTSVETPCSALNFILPNSGRKGGRKCSSASTTSGAGRQASP